ncbi:hypothetical protein CKK33_07990 [Mucilaginibacter sp. MD40]|uniref:hypothetical protein n=1 Tax=Mucilaginibacter sp. MD40 TaxID=2029590 RepID=UPI000BACA67E|nr:hypothetical protein [Mucilaginibacter sp. MD40]PAW93434.1 hypothetical protein CKK33_07990 [Mucilaginibacter sp. MD40]
MISFNRIRVIDHNIVIDKKNIFSKRSANIKGVIELKETIPIINVFEGKEIIRSYVIEPLSSNYDLKGQFLHFSISVQENDAVMIDGIISNRNDSHLDWTDENYEAVRFQPFFLKSSEYQNKQLIGKGLFERGLHYPGTITPGGVRNICICDFCKKSFTLQHIHSGFSEVQYFYSSNSQRTLLVKYGEIENIPVQLQELIDEQSLQEVEAKLSGFSNEGYRYYNSLNCPHCAKPFINFEENKHIRPGEYYANKFINKEFLHYTK